MSTQWTRLKPSDVLTREEIKSFAVQNNMKGAWLVFHCWATILAAGALYVIFPHIFTLLIAVAIIGGRQLGLAILMHDASHGMLFKSNWLNDKIGQFFTAWPVIIQLGAYRTRHMMHHRFTRTDKDPENFLYTPFPVTRMSLTRKFLRDMTGIAFVRGQIGLFKAVANFDTKDPKEKDGKSQKRMARLWGFYRGPLLANALLFAATAAFERPELYLLLWILPLATTQQLFIRIRNIAEHSTMPDTADPLKNSRTTYAGPIERLFLAPYWVNYHVEHHLLPFVPCYHLPRVHQKMLEKGYGPKMELQSNYIDVLKLNSSRPAASQNA